MPVLFPFFIWHVTNGTAESAVRHIHPFIKGVATVVVTDVPWFSHLPVHGRLYFIIVICFAECFVRPSFIFLVLRVTAIRCVLITSAHSSIINKKSPVREGLNLFGVADYMRIWVTSYRVSPKPLSRRSPPRMGTGAVAVVRVLVSHIRENVPKKPESRLHPLL